MAPMSELEPELAGYEPARGSLRSRRRRRMLQVVVLLGLVSLVLPGILVGLSIADRTAASTCAAYITYYAPEAVDFETSFDLFDPALGWNCFAVEFGGDRVLIANLGLIPGGAQLPSAPLQES